MVVHGDRIRAHEADGHSLAQWACRPSARSPSLPVLLKHDGDLTKFEPTPTDSAIKLPLSRHRESETIHIESQGSFDVLHVEERNRLPDIGNVGGLSFHRDV